MNFGTQISTGKSLDIMLQKRRNSCSRPRQYWECAMTMTMMMTMPYVPTAQYYYYLRLSELVEIPIPEKASRVCGQYLEFEHLFEHCWKYEKSYYVILKFAQISKPK